MKRPRATILTATLLLIAGMVWTTSCSNDNNVTNPPPMGNLELNSGNIANGGTYVHTFANAGTYNYHCTIHGAGMAGSVTVVAGQPATAAVTINDNSYAPPNATVAPGGTVTWTNNGSPHTVTSN